jgi:MFS family permease
VSGIIVSIATDLGDVSSVTWIIGGWSIASSVSFSIAGRLSDIFGRRWAMIIGQGFTLIGAVSI